MLDVSSNGFGDGLADELARALSGDDYLLGVNLAATRVTAKGAAALKGALFYDRVLTQHANMTKTDGASRRRLSPPFFFFRRRPAIRVSRSQARC